jgi:hypothetical protein
MTLPRQVLTPLVMVGSRLPMPDLAMVSIIAFQDVILLYQLLSCSLGRWAVDDLVRDMLPVAVMNHD